MWKSIKYWIGELIALALILIAGAVIGCIITLAFIGYEFDVKITEDSATVYTDSPELEIQQIATEWADSHNYTLGEEQERHTFDSDGNINTTVTHIEGRYACDNFSKDLIKELGERGYDAEYCTGDALWCMPWEKESKSCGHAWVKAEIYIEATSGKILNPRDYRTKYIETKCIKLGDTIIADGE